MGAVKKKYGDDFSNFTPFIEEKGIITHSTGSRLLDLAIGEGDRGGFPEGRMIELYGPESSGKCITADTHILTPEGYKTLERIFEENDTPVETKEEEVEAEIPLINRYGEQEETYAITFNGLKEVLHIKTKRGFEIKATKNHPLLVSGEWVEAEKLSVGDSLSVLAGTGIYMDPNLHTNKESHYLDDELLLETKDNMMQILFALQQIGFGEKEISLTREEAKALQLTLLNMGIISNNQDGKISISPEEKELLEKFIEGGHIEQFVFDDPIVSIESIGEEPTFDVAMPETQSFIGNGIINHNTTIALIAIAERQKIENEKAAEDKNYVKKLCVFMDAEFALDTDLAVEYGVDLEELIIIRPDQAEDGMDALDSYIRTGGIGLAVIDSVSALVPAQVEQSSFQQQTMAVLARFMSQVTTRLYGPCYKNGTTLLFINQIREKVGAWSPSGQTPETTPGGRGLKFAASLRIRVRRGETIGAVDNPDGHVMNILIEKNKIGIPKRTASVKLYYGIGVDTVEELGEISIAYGIVHQGGAWFKVVDPETGEVLSFDGKEANYQGRDKFLQEIHDNKELETYIETAVRNLEMSEE